jgi:hypothetical protein
MGCQLRVLVKSAIEKMEAKGSFKVAKGTKGTKGTKGIAVVTLAGKPSATARFEVK